MIVVKTKAEIQSMEQAGRIAANALIVGGKALKPGITTGEVDRMIHEYLLSQGAVPSFLGYGGFPASACISVNDVVIHGIPGAQVINQGDIVSIDVGALFEGFHGDNAYTFGVGGVSQEAEKLMEVTKESLNRGIAVAVVGGRIGDISSAVQTYVESFGYGVVTDFVGHGIGRELHEDPQVPNYGSAGRGPRLVAGMTIAIEPMITQFAPQVRVLGDQWTVETVDGGLCAHYEHTVAITDEGPMILTRG